MPFGVVRGVGRGMGVLDALFLNYFEDLFRIYSRVILCLRIISLSLCVKDVRFLASTTFHGFGHFCGSDIQHGVSYQCTVVTVVLNAPF